MTHADGPYGNDAAQARPGHEHVAETDHEPPDNLVPVSLLISDRFLDRVLDRLTVRAGHPEHTDALGLARWDLKAALLDTIRDTDAR